jgi:hypothetical protein
MPLLAHGVICCGCTKAVGIGAKRTLTKIYEYAPYINCHPHYLHMWRPVHHDVPRPILVGPR